MSRACLSSSDVQEVTGSLGLSAAAFILVCEGLAVILATYPIEFLCHGIARSKKVIVPELELPSFFIHVLASVFLCNYRKHQGLWLVMQVDVLQLRAAKPLECEFNFIGKHLDSDQLKVGSAEIKVLFA